MKKIIFLLAFFVGLSYFCLAQPNRAEKLEALKVAFITKELNLSSEEAQKFWPVYNGYFDELKKARQNNMEDQLKFEETALNIRKKYKPEFKKVLANDDKRVEKLYRLETEFIDRLRREIINRQKNRPRFQAKPQ